MKHNFSFLPSLRRTTLLALLCLGIMPMWAEAYTGNLYVVGDGINGSDYGGANKGILFTTHEPGTSHYELNVQTNHQTGNGFKLLTQNNNWYPQFYGKGSSSGLVEVTKTGTFNLYYCFADPLVNEVKFMPEAEGHFKLVVDLADRDNGTMRVELLKPTNGLSVRGPLATGNPSGSWDAFSNMTKDGDVYTWTYTKLNAGTYLFKFSAKDTHNDTWLSANAATMTANNCTLEECDNTCDSGKFHNFKVTTTQQQDLRITVTYTTVNGEVKATVNATSGEPVPDCTNCEYLGQ